MRESIIPAIPEKCSNCTWLKAALAEASRAENLAFHVGRSAINPDASDIAGVSVAMAEQTAESFECSLNKVNELIDNCKNGTQYIRANRSPFSFSLRFLTSISEGDHPGDPNYDEVCGSKITRRSFQRYLLGQEAKSDS